MSFFNKQKVISIAKRYTTGGHSPYLVVDSDFEQYVLKSARNRTDIDSLIKEFLCAMFLHYWEIDMPESAILEIAEELKSTKGLASNPDLKLSEVFFGSKFQINSIDLSKLFSSENKTSIKRISNRTSLLKIALFDIWIENDD